MQDMKKNKLYDFLKLNGFNLLDQTTSEHFGDYSELFECEYFGLIFSSSKSDETIDIYSLSDKEEVFDLALLKALIFKEDILNIPTTIDEYYKFLKNELCQIKLLFLNSNYLKTKKELEDLGDKRAKQMFPGMIK